MVTLKRLLDSDARLKKSIVSGYSGLEKGVIRTVSVVDSPNSIKAIRGGEVLLTTGYLFVDGEESFYDFVSQIIEKGAYGLGIKLNIYFDKVPESVIQLSNQKSFPIFEVPPDYFWSDMIERFHNLRFESESNLYDLDLDPVEFAGILETSRWDISVFRKKFVEFFHVAIAVIDDNYSVYAMNQEAGKEAIVEFLNNCSKTGYAHMSDVPLLPQKIGAYWVTFQLLNNSRDYIVLATEGGVVAPNALWFIQTLYGFVNIRQHMLQDRNFMFEQLIKKVASEISPIDLKQFVSLLDLDERAIYGFIVIQGKAAPKGLELLTGLVKEEEYLLEMDIHCITQNHQAEIVVLYNVVEEKKEEYDIIIFLRKILQRIRKENEATFIIGNPVSHVEDLKQAYDQCYEAEAVAKVAWPNEKIIFYNDIEILSKLKDVSINFEDLKDIKHQNISFNGIDTLEAYLINDNFKQSALKMDVHENTMRYRINRIGELIQMDLENPMIKYNLLTKIKLWKILQMHK